MAVKGLLIIENVPKLLNIAYFYAFENGVSGMTYSPHLRYIQTTNQCPREDNSIRALQVLHNKSTTKQLIHQQVITKLSHTIKHSLYPPEQNNPSG